MGFFSIKYSLLCQCVGAGQQRQATQTQLHCASEKQPEPRETLEYRAALELELWKEMQEDIFENQVFTLLLSKQHNHLEKLWQNWWKELFFFLNFLICFKALEMYKNIF